MSADDDANAATLATYEQAAETYRARSDRDDGPDWEIDAVGLVRTHAEAGASVLEIGSGPGWDADRLEAAGFRVRRPDATRAFVEMQRAHGHTADLIDVRRDSLTGPGGERYDAVLANAVLLHIDRAELPAVLGRLSGAVHLGGVLVATVKAGDGEAWSRQKMDLPRHFVYWRAGPLAEVVASSGWSVVSLDEVERPAGPWLMLVARRSSQTDMASTPSPATERPAPTTAGAV